jgi:vanillate O-demethylase ferredoxin subunit
MIPQRLGAIILVRSFARIQHPEGVRWEDAPFQTTYRVETNQFGKVFMLGQAVHCLHHLAPNVPFYRYHEAWALGRHLFERQNVPVRSLWSAPKSIELPRSQEQVWLDARVESVQQVGTDIQSYTFIPATKGTQWPRFSPGSHIDVKVDDKHIRQYSLCNNPVEQNRYVIAVKKDEQGRGGSKLLHETIRPGDIVEVGSPRNNFPLNMDFAHYVLIAGGIGITPLMSMAHALQAANKSFEMHICARDEAAKPFADDLQDVAFADAVHVYLDNADMQQRFGVETVLGQYKNGTALYLCGPGGFMSAVMQAGEQLGWPQAAMFSETFAPPKIDASENKPFEVFLARSKKTLTVPANEFLIDVLHNNGHPVMCSCTQGICGSCITPVLEGVPEHRDAVMSDAERNSNKQMCVCVSRARSERLVLDI